MDTLLGLGIVMAAFPAAVFLFFVLRTIKRELLRVNYGFENAFIILALLSFFGFLPPLLLASPVNDPSSSMIFYAQITALIWLAVVNVTTIVGLYGWKTGKFR